MTNTEELVAVAQPATEPVTTEQIPLDRRRRRMIRRSSWRWWQVAAGIPTVVGAGAIAGLVAAGRHAPHGTSDLTVLALLDLAYVRVRELSVGAAL